MRAKLSVCVALLLAGCAGPDNDRPSGLDLPAIDLSADPCVDFYQYACGGWMRSHPLNGYSYDGKFFEPYYEAYPRLKAIIVGDAAGDWGPDDPHADLIGSYYKTCLDAPSDLSSRDKLLALMGQIDAMSTLDDVARQVADQSGQGSYTFFYFNVAVDPGDAARYTAFVTPGGTELDSGYYLDASKKDILTKYEAHIKAMSALIGGTPVDAAAAIRVETALAQAASKVKSTRDPASLYHRMKAVDAAALAPSFPWQSFWSQAGFEDPGDIDVTSPEYLTAIDQVWKSTPLDDLKAYMRWQLLQDHASELDQAFLDEDFSFWSTFTGQTSLAPRDFTCYNRTLNALGQAVARPFVARYFDGRRAETTRAIVELLRAAFTKRLQSAPWLDGSTRSEALSKLDAMVAKVGFPEKDVDYTGLSFGPTSFFDNAVALAKYNRSQSVGLLGQAVDRSLWRISPTTVNAIYSPSSNDLSLPAALLTSPFLDADRIEAVNFGALGVVAGHEMTHGFDDSGRYYDGTGTLRDWWTPAVENRFVQRAQCLVSQFDTYEALPGEHVDGELTLGENIADFGGINVAYDALFNEGAEPLGGDGFNADQVFFLAYAQTWCEVLSPELQSQRLHTDPHAPGRFRVNGPLSNHPGFRDAFSCDDTSPMARDPPCEIW